MNEKDKAIVDAIEQLTKAIERMNDDVMDLKAWSFGNFRSAPNPRNNLAPNIHSLYASLGHLKAMVATNEENIGMLRKEKQNEPTPPW
jgi:hypothetical protein